MSNVIRIEVKGYYAYHCPGCKHLHAIPTKDFKPTGGYIGPTWDFNEDFEKPTFSPSIKHTYNREGNKKKICHYFIKEGNIEFCVDSTHELAGKTVPLEEIE